MRAPAELDSVQWHTLTHAYGPAEDVPHLIAGLYEDDEETAGEALYELYGTIHHQGTVYAASAPAVPFLAHAALHAPAKRDEVLMLLAVLAGHDPADVGLPHWADTPTAAICAELCRVLPELLPCLGDPDRAVRRAALRVVAAPAGLLTAQQRATAVARVEEVYAADPVPAVRADALVALSRYGRERAAALAGPLPEVRLAAAALGLARSGPPYPADLVDTIAEDGAEPDPGDDAFPWPGTDTTSPDDHLRNLLTEDPDAALAVAARWIAAGDLGARGSWLAEEVAETWRDREPAVVALMAAALPHQRTAVELNARLRTIGHWIDLFPEPDAGLRDTLFRYADTDGESAAPALLALVRSRDPRALELVLRRTATATGSGTGPDAGPGVGVGIAGRLLAAAARAFPEADDRLVPEIRRLLAAGATGNEAIALVGALAEFGAAAHQARPELVDCLRTRRAAIVAARRLGADGVATREVTDLLHEATGSRDPALRGAAAAAHCRLTGDPGPALRTFEDLLTGRGRTSWYLGSLEPMGDAAAPLLPLVERHLEAGDAWTRLAAAEALYRITGSADRSVPVLAELAGPTPVGLRAVRALAAVGRAPQELHPTLHTLAFSPRRLLGDAPHSGDGHPDTELRAWAHRLLEAARPQESA
ncbi:hypothetical protein ACFXA3_04420 [Streptomyces sp. NPDC059456]|uniref:hypothetical protein n=1 Tax=Streptomyces sp. NPDC059456 TaxID=3346838 RepID=UPI0036906C12